MLGKAARIADAAADWTFRAVAALAAWIVAVGIKPADLARQVVVESWVVPWRPAYGVVGSHYAAASSIAVMVRCPGFGSSMTSLHGSYSHLARMVGLQNRSTKHPHNLRNDGIA